ncbi:MAG: hypothetical protein M3Z21_00865 [Pseudomonadota bacterium]|nr:hypothetical protein [Pseudomonadota bacterium]
MNTVVIEHVKASDLPEAWRTRLPAAPDVRFTVRIEQEPASEAAGVEADTAFGMWGDRDNLADVEAYVRKLRAPRPARD